MNGWLPLEVNGVNSWGSEEQFIMLEDPTLYIGEGTPNNTTGAIKAAPSGKTTQLHWPTRK